MISQRILTFRLIILDRHLWGYFQCVPYVLGTKYSNLTAKTNLRDSGCVRFRLSVIKQVVLNKQARSCYSDLQLQKRAGSLMSIKWNVKESGDTSLSKKSHQQLTKKTSGLHLLYQVLNSIDKWNVFCVLASGRILRKTNDSFSVAVFKRFKYGSEWWEKAAEMMWKKILPLHKNMSHLRVVVKVWE